MVRFGVTIVLPTRCRVHSPTMTRTFPRTRGLCLLAECIMSHPIWRCEAVAGRANRTPWAASLQGPTHGIAAPTRPAGHPGQALYTGYLQPGTQARCLDANDTGGFCRVLASEKCRVNPRFDGDACSDFRVSTHSRMLECACGSTDPGPSRRCSHDGRRTCRRCSHDGRRTCRRSHDGRRTCRRSHGGSRGSHSGPGPDRGASPERHAEQAVQDGLRQLGRVRQLLR